MGRFLCLTPGGGEVVYWKQHNTQCTPQIKIWREISMPLIIFIVILFLVIRHVRKKKAQNAAQAEGQPFVAPAAGSKAEKKAIQEFKYQLQVASGEYGRRAVESMERVAKCYALGDGVEKDVEKAKQWQEKAFRATLQQKAYFDEIWGATGYSAPEVDFFLDGALVPPDVEKAQELAWLLALTGTDNAAAELKKVYEKKDPEFAKTMDAARAVADYPVMCMGLEARSKRIYSELCDEMQAAGVSGLAAEIDYVLKKAGWNVPIAPVTFPGATPGLDEKFAAARAIEAKGRDFKAAADAYEAIVTEGHTEAMRRLGRLRRDVLSKDAVCFDYTYSQALLRDAAQAGNALAAFDLGYKEIDAAFIAGLAAQGNLDALYALGCMLEQGIGGKDNWGAGQFMFRTMEKRIGDAAANKDGEGLEWLRKLGKKFYIVDEKYYVRLADAGSEIGYLPSRVALIYMSDEMMRRAYDRSNNKFGAGYDFGYSDLIIKLAEEPSAAGMAKAAKISRALREERSAAGRWVNKELEEAEQGKGSWSYAANRGMSAHERVARQTASCQRSATAVYYTRLQQGANFYSISEHLRNTEDFDGAVAGILNQMAARERARAPFSGGAASRARSHGDVSPGSASGCTFPEYLTIGGESYRLEYSDNEKATYYCSRTGDRRVIWGVELNT